jgi:polyribonucleotide nucleotidyltransferase
MTNNDTQRSPQQFTARLGGKDVIIETGRFAAQAGGAVTFMTIR